MGIASPVNCIRATRNHAGLNGQRNDFILAVFFQFYGMTFRLICKIGISVFSHFVQFNKYFVMVIYIELW